MPLTEEELFLRDSKRDTGAELLQSVREIDAGNYTVRYVWGRTPRSGAKPGKASRVIMQTNDPGEERERGSDEDAKAQILSTVIQDKLESRKAARAMSWPEKVAIIERVREATTLARKSMTAAKCRVGTHGARDVSSHGDRRTEAEGETAEGAQE